MNNFFIKKEKPKTIFLYTPTLEGGVGRIVINLFKGFKNKNYKTTIIVNNLNNKFIINDSGISLKTEIINLKVKHTYQAIWKITKILKKHNPYIIISHIFHANIAILIIKKFFKITSKIIICEHISLKESLRRINFLKRIIIKFLIKFFYSTSDFIVGVSQNNTSEIEEIIGPLYKNKIKTIYNPIVEDLIFIKAEAKINHPWFNNNYKIILSSGRLTEQKDYPTLIKAFKIVHNKISTKLIILGEGPEKKSILSLIKELKLENDIDLVGFVENPYPYYKYCDLFVLSSRYEGLPTVLIEALAFGKPVISTDCLTGPSEILENGKYGKLVPVGDYNALAKAILEIINNDLIFEEALLKERAKEFDLESRVNDYIKLIEFL